MKLFIDGTSFSDDSFSIIVAVFAMLTILICMIIFIKTYRKRKIEFFKDEILFIAYKKSHPYLKIDKKLAQKNANEQLSRLFNDSYFDLLKRVGILTSDNKIYYAQLDRAGDMMCYMLLKENMETDPKTKIKDFPEL